MGNQKTELQIEIIGRIKNMRQQNGISQKDMADYLDVTAGEIGNIESLKYKNKYTLKHLMLISKHLHVSIGELLFDKDHIREDVDAILERIVEYIG